MFKIVAPLLVTAATFGHLESSASACHLDKVCVGIPATAVDAYVGDIGTSGVVPARGTRVRLVTPGTEGVKEFWLDDEGCFEFETRYNYGLKLQVFPEAFVGNDANVWIRAVDEFSFAVHALGLDPTGSFVVTPPLTPAQSTFTAAADGGVVPWRIDIDYILGDAATEPPTHVQLPQDDISNMLGWTLEAFHNVDQYAGIVGDRMIVLHTEAGDPNAALGGYNNNNRSGRSVDRRPVRRLLERRQQPRQHVD